MIDTTITVRTFRVGTDKECARKLPEEAAEAFSAWEGGHVGSLADELADVVQAACNLSARYGIDMEDAMRRCEQRNRERGRYE